MRISLGNIRSVITKVNKKGAALLNRETGLNISKAKELGVHIPDGATEFDVSRVGRDFDFDNHYTDIFTFRNKEEGIVTQYIRKIDNDDIVETTKKIEKIYPNEIDLVPDGSKTLDIHGTNIRSSIRTNGSISEYSDEFFSVTDEAVPVLTHSKRTVTPSDESILLEQKQKGKPTKSIFNKYIIDQYANGDFQLIESRVSSDELNEIAQNSYFLPFVSPQKKFPSRITQAAISDAEFIDRPEVSLYREKTARAGYFSTTDGIRLNLISSRGINQPRIEITSTAAHEVEHAKWDENTMVLAFKESGFCDEFEFTPEMVEKIKKYKDAIDHYVPAHIDKKAYHNNYAEVIARQGGARAVKKYYELNDKLKEQFPFQHNFQFYPYEDTDDVSWFYTIVRTAADL